MGKEFSEINPSVPAIESTLKQLEKIQREKIPSIVLVEFDTIQTRYKTDRSHLGYKPKEFRQQIIKKEGGKEAVKYYLIGELMIPKLRSIPLHPQPIVCVVTYEDGKVIDVHIEEGDILVRKD